MKRPLMKRLAFAAIALALIAGPLAVLAAGERAALIAGYATQAKAADPSFAEFSAARGETLFRTAFAGGDPRTPSCTSCHTADPRALGRNAKTGRPIDPMAVSVNPQRFLNAAELDKHFARDCKSVMGRDCTPLERGDFVTFMMGR